MLTIRRLVWDTWNVGRIARRDVTPDDVDEVCQGALVSSETYEGRLRAIGPTTQGHMLTVILARHGAGAYYVVTARPASRKERRPYEELARGDTP